MRIQGKSNNINSNTRQSQMWWSECAFTANVPIYLPTLGKARCEGVNVHSRQTCKYKVQYEAKQNAMELLRIHGKRANRNSNTRQSQMFLSGQQCMKHKATLRTYTQKEPRKNDTSQTWAHARVMGKNMRHQKTSQFRCANDHMGVVINPIIWWFMGWSAYA